MSPSASPLSAPRRMTTGRWSPVRRLLLQPAEDQRHVMAQRVQARLQRAELTSAVVGPLGVGAVQACPGGFLETGQQDLRGGPQDRQLFGTGPPLQRQRKLVAREFEQSSGP